jgi:uncharacterized protein (TIGR00251 family)
LWWIEEKGRWTGSRFRLGFGVRRFLRKPTRAPEYRPTEQHIEERGSVDLKQSIVRMENGIRIIVYVVPNAKETRLQLEIDGSLLMRVDAPPVKGKANREIAKWFSRKLRKPSSQIRIVAGLASRTKTLEITGIDEASFLEAIGQR